uniref:Eco57I restriction-modification methylase domain-containing protein n=1 Tax=Streptomyces sp. TaxID=1931 RepID=UPI0035C70AD5
AERHAITEIEGDGVEALGQKREHLRAGREKTARLRLVGDLIAGAALATCASGRVPWYDPQSGERVRDLFPSAARWARQVVGEARTKDSVVTAEAREQAREWLTSELPDGSLGRVPLHWPLEFPEVFVEQGGFDAVVGNPPFLGGKKLTGALGDAYREYMVDHLAKGKRGSADLVAYFELRVHQLLNKRGQAGVIATNTLAQGDSREVGLDQIVSDGVSIRRAIKSSPWPSSSAVLEYCAVWTSKRALGSAAKCVLGGLVVSNGISTSLNPATREKSWVDRLDRNAKKVFQGSLVLVVDGFSISEQVAREWIEEEEKYREVLFPLLNGQDLNGSPDLSASRWVINFHEWPEGRAKEYRNAYAKLLAEVKPECESKDPKSYAGLMDRWWQYWRPRSDMIQALNGLDRCIVLALVSKSVMPAMVSTKQVFTHLLGVFASDDYALLAFLSSAPHYWWAIDRASTMKGDLRYTPTDVFETLVRPPLTERLRASGKRLDAFRGELMQRRGIGLTAVYNLAHDPACQDDDIVELRCIHEEIDKAVVDAYGWHDLLDEAGQTSPADATHEMVLLDHGFHETDQGTRYTIGLLARTEIIDRLRQLNHQVYADEVYLGLHKKPKKYPDMPPPSEDARRKRAEQKWSVNVDFDDGGVFQPEDTIF